mmetsp:Transcript_14721/g.19401  ORF Transcript_14721/g.19401 Transcript_14721/m.19401 type:complete len:84 (+) Transcript_14721:2157-2408(+)
MLNCVIRAPKKNAMCNFLPSTKIPHGNLCSNVQMGLITSIQQDIQKTNSDSIPQMYIKPFAAPISRGQTIIHKCTIPETMLNQ